MVAISTEANSDSNLPRLGDNKLGVILLDNIIIKPLLNYKNCCWKRFSLGFR